MMSGRRHFGHISDAEYHRECYYERQEFQWNAMKRGPYYRDGELRIPAYVYDPEISPRANEDWKGRGFRWHAEAKEWRRAIPAADADEQVLKARRAFTHYWPIELNPFKLAKPAATNVASPS